jgi:hypothetical protein
VVPLEGDDDGGDESQEQEDGHVCNRALATNPPRVAELTSEALFLPSGVA